MNHGPKAFFIHSIPYQSILSSPLMHRSEKAKTSDTRERSGGITRSSAAGGLARVYRQNGPRTSSLFCACRIARPPVGGLRSRLRRTADRQLGCGLAQILRFRKTSFFFTGELCLSAARCAKFSFVKK